MSLSSIVEQRLEALELAMESKTAEIETMYLFWAGTLVFSMQACMLGAATISRLPIALSVTQKLPSRLWVLVSSLDLFERSLPCCL